MQSVVALMLVLGAGGFILLAFFTSLEMMLMTLAWTLVGASGFALDALVLTLYGAFVLAPALVVSLYKAFAPKEVKALGGLWHLMFPLMLVLVALTTASLEDLALFSGHLWVFQKLAFLPGLLGCFMGGVFLWLSLCWLRELGVTDKPMVSFSVTTFHYWFLATCQMLGLIFFHEIGIMAMNFFLIGLLPFLYSAIVRLLTGPFLAPWALWAKALGGFFAMALGLPLILMILSVLFQPWMGRQRHG